MILRHNQPHEWAGQTVVITEGFYAGEEYRVIDYWDRVNGEPYHPGSNNPAEMDFTMRILDDGGVPLDGEFLYGKIRGLGKIIHVSEIRP